MRKNTGTIALDRLKKECRKVSTRQRWQKIKTTMMILKCYDRCRKQKLLGYFQTELPELDMITGEEEEKERKREMDEGGRRWREMIREHVEYILETYT